MPASDLLKTPGFRMAISFSVTLAASILLLFFFIFWESSVVETQRVDHQLERDAEILAHEPPAYIATSVNRRVAADFHRILYSALFDPAGQPVIGNLPHIPTGLPLDGQAHRAHLHAAETDPLHLQEGRMVGRRLADGRILVIGRNVDSLQDLEDVGMRALEMGVAPALVITLLGGLIIGQRAQRQVQVIHEAAERIAQGKFAERLPILKADSNLDRLASNVNLMLDGVVQNLEQMKSSNDHIAHDLRTPLTRVRAHLDRARETPHHNDKLLDQAIAGLDHALRIIAALRRISEIEASDRHAGFAFVDLEAVAEEVVEFYAPLAEEKNISLSLSIGSPQRIEGDRDLLIEALANLVDNAVKFAPNGGYVQLSLRAEGHEAILRVEDNGPGIPTEERNAVMRRFYRSQQTRHLQGTGLGLSIVEAIAKLHGITLTFADCPQGCCVEMRAPRT